LKELNIDSAFEFGCNAGYNLQVIADKKIYGIDINQEAINFGQKKLGLPIEYGSEKKLKDIPSKSYDLVFTSSVLDHIPKENFLDIVNELKRISKKYVICLETNDEQYYNYFAHDYESQGFKSVWDFFSSRYSGGNGCLYKCYRYSV
jgi:ubiquinone/menaquinone biosynthesis C-methylase UbiE